MRLTDGEYLNDNMVDLQIKRIVIWRKYYDLHPLDFHNMSDKQRWNSFDESFMISIPPPEDRESPLIGLESDHNTSSVYAFSSMFYQKLTEQKKTLSYELVKKWTKNVDIFSKDFLFIPINLGSHWSLLCVVRPGLFRKEVSFVYAYFKFLRLLIQKEVRKKEKSLRRLQSKQYLRIMLISYQIFQRIIWWIQAPRSVFHVFCSWIPLEFTA